MTTKHAICSDCGIDVEYVIKDEVINLSNCPSCNAHFKEVVNSPSTGNVVLLGDNE